MGSFPHLYTCKECEAPVSVVNYGVGIEPTIIRKCGHDNAGVWANRKTVLRGKGGIKMHHKITLTIRQLLSVLLKRSV